MKRLILLRHAKSDWEAGGASDHERPLAKRGRKAAHSIGRFLSALEQIPDSVVSSSAVRARTTVELAATAGGWDCPQRITPALYDASPDRVLHEVQREPDSSSLLLLAGHEPTWSHLGSLLIGGGRLKTPTAALARIDFYVDSWRQVSYGGGTLAWLMTPKTLAAARL